MEGIVLYVSILEVWAINHVSVSFLIQVTAAADVKGQ